MTSSEKRKDTMLKKKYDKSDMKKSMQKQYGKEEGKKVYFATIRKQAMEEVIPEAKVDKGKSDYAKQNERNQRTFGNRRGSRGSLASHDDTEARRYNTKKSRGVKMRGKKDKTPVIITKKIVKLVLMLFSRV